MFAVHQRVAHATVFGDADALSTARRRRGTSMGGVAIRGVRPEHALVGPFGHMRIVANAVGPEPPLVADAFIAVAVSVREALGVALLPLRTVGHDEPRTHSGTCLFGRIDRGPSLYAHARIRFTACLRSHTLTHWTCTQVPVHTAPAILLYEANKCNEEGSVYHYSSRWDNGWLHSRCPCIHRGIGRPNAWRWTAVSILICVHGMKMFHH